MVAVAQTVNVKMEKELNSFYIQWHITKMCNCRCKHCYQNDYSSNNELNYEQLIRTFLKIKDFLKFFYNTYPQNEKYIPILSITGGEPFLRTDFLQFLKTLSSNKEFFYFILLSNGTLITKELAYKLKEYGIRQVQISIEGSEKIHNYIRGEGTFKKALNGIEHLLNAKIKVSLSFTANKFNYKEFSNVVNIGKKLGVNNIWTDRFIPIINNDFILSLSKEETKNYIEIINNEYKKEPNLVSNFRALQKIGTNEEKKLYSCHAGFNNFAILENGDILPCRRMPVKLGNIIQDSLIDIYLNNSYIKKLREEYEKTPIGCENCKLVKVCNGGLKCLSFAAFNNSLVKDPGCWLK